MARFPARPENPFAFNVPPGFSPASVPAIQGPPSLCHSLLKPLCRRRAVCAPDDSAGESAFHRNSGLVKSTKPKLCRMNTSGIEHLKPFTISTSITKDLNPPQMNTYAKNGEGPHSVAQVVPAILSGSGDLRLLVFCPRLGI